MTLEAWLAYGGYLAWLAVGLCDFLVHRRTDLPHTSGVAESTTHLLQLALLGLAVMAGMGFEVGRMVALLLLALVVAHAAVGYWDSRIAFDRARVVLPVEQHLHSVLDMAPPIALAWLLATTWPAAMRRAGRSCRARRRCLPRRGRRRSCRRRRCAYFPPCSSSGRHGGQRAPEAGGRDYSASTSTRTPRTLLPATVITKSRSAGFFFTSTSSPSSVSTL
jgi:hypothetical protein